VAIAQYGIDATWLDDADKADLRRHTDNQAASLRLQLTKPSR
jgi:hypothetical protein